MAAKTLKKNLRTYKSYIEFEESSKKQLDNVLFYCSQDAFEFDLIVNRYREKLKIAGEPVEIIVFVSEPGDMEKLFAEITNLSMFSSMKLIIIKSGRDFFKPLLLAKNKNLLQSYTRNFQEISEKIYILVHYDDKAVPDKLMAVFAYKMSYLKNRNYYPYEKRKALESLLKHEKATMSHQAMDEFLHKIHPNTGSYLKNIQKLKLLLNKNHFEWEDVEEALFNRNDFNPFYMSDMLFQNNKREFFKEFSKLSLSEENRFGLLSLLTVLLNRTDEVRKARILFHRMADDEAKIFQLLGMSSYSEKRRAFVRSRLRKEVNMFHSSILDTIYKTITELNILSKTGSNQEQTRLLFTEKMLKVFQIMENRS